MKKVLLIAMSIVLLQACDNNANKSGVQATENDGMKLGDTNGGLADTTFKGNTAATDSSKMEDRVDVSTRDTFNRANK
jgi:hypothetical protein